jgi:hypothetical protein
VAGRLTARRTRRRHETKFRLHKPGWIDPFPSIPGTQPEKMVFEALVRRRIFFIFQGQIPELQRGLYAEMAIPGYKPDFILPEYRVIIDPFSPYHHSLPEAIERDARKFATYTALGYKFYFPWALGDGIFEFSQTGVHFKRPVKFRQAAITGRYVGALAMLSAIPELHGKKVRKLTKKQKALYEKQGYELGPFLGAGATSVAAANRKRRKPKPLSLSRGTRRSKVQRVL